MIQLLAGFCLMLGIILMWLTFFLQHSKKEKSAKIAGLFSLLMVFASPAVMLIPV